MNQQSYDVIVVGSGIGGLSYALSVAERETSLSVAIITKKEDRESNTNYAQGGIASVLSAHDSFASHVADTLSAGAGLCRPDVVERVVRSGPAAIRRLQQAGVEFTRSKSGELDLALEGGHSARRVAHAADLTGQEIERALLARCRACVNVTLLENHFAADILTVTENQALRAAALVVYDTHAGRFVTFGSRLVMLATGGVGQVYAQTTNPLIATGDGIAMAFRAGCAVANLEFVQFHPTAFYEDSERSLLISEAVRGHGAQLLNLDGRSFMSKYDERAELAPRDIVARAIDSELKKTGATHALLDLSAIDPQTIKDRFPGIYQGCIDRGVDITREPIPVVPSAHYLCGGVRATLEGQTDVRGLLVCGETAHTGMHGANRLASNSLLEAVIMAELASSWTCENMGGLAAVSIPPNPLYTRTGRRDAENILLAHDRRSLKFLMSDFLGIVRSIERLELARERISAINRAVEREFPYLPDVYGALELRNISLVSLLMTEMALARRESRGLHYLLDYPERDDEHWRRDSVIEPRRGRVKVAEERG
ncbi:MAG: L-aspartate oxidase [Candidatus Zixiibacteriota bacterium]